MHQALVEWVVRDLDLARQALGQEQDQALDQEQDQDLDQGQDLLGAVDHSNWIVLQGLVSPCFLFSLYYMLCS